ncbi:RNA polymerase sigma factor, partial [Candidatus Gracilibacteria bacterium]|nr:RNA polymerase sigma factor [Candidatus Gracilibacteria bacterium]
RSARRRGRRDRQRVAARDRATEDVLEHGALTRGRIIGIHSAQITRCRRPLGTCTRATGTSAPLAALTGWPGRLVWLATEQRFSRIIGQFTPPGRQACVRPRDRDPFEEIYRQHRSRVYAAARRLGVKAQELDDVVQQTFIIAHARLHSFEGRSSMSTWLIGILRNVVRNARRAAHRHSAYVAHDEPTHGSAYPGCGLEDLMLQRAMLDILQHWDAKKREAFIAHTFGGKTLREIAESTGSSIGAVHARIRAARSELSCRLRPSDSLHGFSGSHVHGRTRA